MNIVKKTLKKYNDIPVAAKATLWFMFCSILQKCISLITTPIFTRIMSTTQYGQFSVYNSWLNIFSIFATLRLNLAVFNKGMNKYKDDRDTYTATMQTITFCITCCMFVVYLLFHEQINRLTELPTFIMVAMFAELLFMPAIDFWTVRKRYEYIYKPVVFRTLAMAFLNAAIGVIAVLLSEEKGYVRILTCILVNMCFGISLFVYNYRKSKRFFKKEYAVFAIMFNLPLLLHYVSQYILDQFDRIMVQKMVGIAAAGIYGVAYNAGLLMRIVTQSINSALVPWQYDQLEKGDLKRLDDVLFGIYLLIASVAFIFSACAPEIMKILADETYHEAVYVIPPVAIGLVFSFMYTTFANVEFFYNQNKFTMFISMGGALLNIVLNYIFINLYGYIAAAYTTLFCYVFFALSHYVYMTSSVKRFLKIEKVFNTTRLVLLSVVILVIGLLVVFVYEWIWIRYAIIVLVCGLAYLSRNRILSILKEVNTKKK